MTRKRQPQKAHAKENENEQTIIKPENPEKVNEREKKKHESMSIMPDGSIGAGKGVRRQGHHSGVCAHQDSNTAIQQPFTVAIEWLCTSSVHAKVSQQVWKSTTIKVR